MDWFIVISLIALGWILLFLEIFIIPGITILAVIGIVLMLSGIYFSFSHFGETTGWITSIVTFAISALSLVIAMRSGFWKKLSLRDTLDSRMNEEDLTKVKVGDEAIAVSRVAPVGKAQIGEDLIEVHSLSGYIDEGTTLEVVKISMNKIFVKPKN